MTRPGIEPRSPGPLANTLTAGQTQKIYGDNKGEEAIFYMVSFDNQWLPINVSSHETLREKLKIIWI